MTGQLKKAFRPVSYSNFGAVALLFLRVIVGLAFMLHGWGKIQAPFSWMGPDSPIPGFLLALAALSEFGGGLAWILGLLTPLASLGIAITMAVAASFHMIVQGDPFVSQTGGPSGELAVVFLAIAILLMAFGPGRLSLDQLIFRDRGSR
ncbi:MAG: DoxX family protein [Bdellovibrionaceae bacterium]|nr:DoxX family protein [Pseudobdellovibrionaceae bacterium]